MNAGDFLCFKLKRFNDIMGEKEALMERGEFEAGPVQTQPSVMYKRKNNPALAIMAVVFAIAAIGLGIWVAILLNDKPKEEKKTSSSETSQQSTESGEGESAKLPRLYLDSDSYLSGSRYHFASSYTLQSDDLSTRTMLDKKMYLVDFAKTGTEDMVKEYDLKSLVEPKFNEFVASLPDTIRPSNDTSVKKTDATFIVTYDKADYAYPEEYYDPDKYLQFEIHYSMAFKYGGSATLNAETGLATYVAIVDIPGHKIVNYAKVDR